MICEETEGHIGFRGLELGKNRGSSIRPFTCRSKNLSVYSALKTKDFRIGQIKKCIRNITSRPNLFYIHLRQWMRALISIRLWRQLSIFKLAIGKARFSCKA